MFPCACNCVCVSLCVCALMSLHVPKRAVAHVDFITELAQVEWNILEEKRTRKGKVNKEGR